MLPHESLKVFWLAEEYVAWLDGQVLPKIRRVSQRDFGQIDGSAGSLIYNIIEAAADKPPLDKARFFIYARREVNESYGIIWRNYRRGVISAEAQYQCRYQEEEEYQCRCQYQEDEEYQYQCRCQCQEEEVYQEQ